MSLSIEELIETVNRKLAAQTIPSKTMLSRFMVNEESSRNSFAYTDPRYLPFFYYLGCQVQPRSFVEFGIRLGLCSGPFFMSCKTVEHFLAFQKQTEAYYSLRLARRNIKQFYKKEFLAHVGHLGDQQFLEAFKRRQWDLAAINDERSYDEYMSYLNLIWPQLSDDGLIIMDNTNYLKPATKAYHDFCKIVGRKPLAFKSKYGIGIIQK